jgi:hypothetical protein
VSLSPTQVGRAAFPNILSDVVRSVTPVNLTTMDRGLQSAYSRQASVEVEQQLGDARDGQRELPVSARLNLLMSMNQNVPTCVAVRHEQFLPAELRTTPTTASTPADGRSNYDGLHVSVAQRPASVGALSGLIHLVQVEEQRRGVLLQLPHRSFRRVERLESLRRRSAASTRDQWRSPITE